MSEQAIPGGKIDEQGFSRWLYSLFTPGVGIGINETAWKAIQRAAGANMSVDVQQGDGYIDISSSYGYWGWVASSDKNVSVDAADPSNPRRDILVAYIDLASISTSVTNNTGALKFKVVAGTPAGSPADPSGSTIQTAVGASNPYIRLARIAVAAGATSISTANITDLRTSIALRAPLAPRISSLSATTTLSYAYDTVHVDASGGAKTITLPDATLLAGRKFTIIKSDSSANGVTVGRTSSQTINGSANDLVFYQQYQGAEFTSDGTGWVLTRWIGTRLLKLATATGTITANTSVTTNTLTATLPPIPVRYEINGQYMFHGSVSVNDIRHTLSDGTNEVAAAYSHSAAQNQRTKPFDKSKPVTSPGSVTLTSTLAVSANAGSIVGTANVPVSIAIYID